MKKICSSCGATLPMTEEYFGRRRGSPDGFRPECRECQAEIERERKKQESPDDPLDARLKKVVDACVAHPEALDIGNVRALADAGLQAFGGPEGIMARYASLFIQGSVHQRMRILDAITKLVKEADKLSEKENENELIDDKELEKRTEEIILKIANAKTA